jgi:hypothetical protein
MTTNGRVGERNGTKPEDPLDPLFATGEEVLNEHESLIDRAIEKSIQLQKAEAKYGTPGTAKVKVRRDGFWGKKNEADLAWVEAEIANRNREIVTAEHVADLGKIVASGKKYITDCVGYMTTIDEELPDHLQPIGQALTKLGTKALIGAYAVSIEMLSAKGFEEIAQVKKPGE